jgi:hypothetical protein
MSVHAISHYDPSASYRIAEWQTAYDDRAGATSHSSVTDVPLGKEKLQILKMYEGMEAVWAREAFFTLWRREHISSLP